RTDLRFSPRWVADLETRDAVDEASFELIGDVVYQDKALGGDAALAGVLVAGANAGFGRSGDVGVGQHDERVGAAELEDGLLDRPAACRTDLAAGAIAARKRNGADAAIVN